MRFLSHRIFFFVSTPLFLHPLYPLYLPVYSYSTYFALTFSTGPHMEHCWPFFLLEVQQNPLQGQLQFDNVCLSHRFFFQMRSWKNLVAFCPPYTPVFILLLKLLCIPAGPSFPFCLSLSSHFWLALWTEHGAQCHCQAMPSSFPSFGCVLQPHWGLPSPCTAPL